MILVISYFLLLFSLSTVQIFAHGFFKISYISVIITRFLFLVWYVFADYLNLSRETRPKNNWKGEIYGNVSNLHKCTCWLWLDLPQSAGVGGYIITRCNYWRDPTTISTDEIHMQPVVSRSVFQDNINNNYAKLQMCKICINTVCVFFHSQKNKNSAGLKCPIENMWESSCFKSRPYFWTPQVLTAGRWPACQHSHSGKRNERCGLVHICLQLGTGNGRKRAVAVVWTLWRSSERESDSRFTDEQVQRLRFRDHDQLWRGSSGDPILEWVHPWKPRSSGLFQD